MTPYQYVTNNPIMFTDPTGMSEEGLSPIFGSDGKFRGTTKEGYTGDILIYDGDLTPQEKLSPSGHRDLFNFSNLSESEMIEKGAVKMDDVRNSMSSNSLSNIYTHVASQLDGTIVDGNEFNVKDLEGGKVHHGKYINGSWQTYGKVFGKKGWNDKIEGTNAYTYESTVENLQASIIYHEWNGHIKNKFSDDPKYNNHSKAIESVMKSPIWNRTTEKYQRQNKKLYEMFKAAENKRK